MFVQDSKLHKNKNFQPLDRKLHILKRSSISLLPNCPKEAQRCCTPHFLSLSSNE